MVRIKGPFHWVEMYVSADTLESFLVSNDVVIESSLPPKFLAFCCTNAFGGC